MKAIIFFTRAPIAGRTKTRMQPYLSPDECAALHKAMIKDIYEECSKIQADIFVYYTPLEGLGRLYKLIGKESTYRLQKGADLGEKMYDAIAEVLDLGYESCILIGSDIAELRKEHLNTAFDKLEYADVVFGKTVDGGYYLVGMKRAVKEVFEVEKYGNSDVFANTLKRLSNLGLKVAYTKTLYDIDTKDDLALHRQRLRKYASRRSKYYKELKKRNLGKFALDKLKISIIIPVYNEEKTIVNLQSKLHSLYEKCEIIFVDGGSTDATLSLIDKKYKLFSSEKGRANQMNKGALESSGDVLLFLHSDSTLPKNALRQIKKVMKDYEAGCFGISFNTRSILMKICALMSNYRVGIGHIMFGDQGIFIDRTVFFNIGMFPSLPIMEDYQLSLTLKSKKIKTAMTKSHITTSDRRFTGNSIDKLKLMLKMYRLRSMYRKGVDIEKIASLYKDKR